MKNFTCVVIFALIASATIVYANDLAIYSGPSNIGWISANAVKDNTETVMNHAGVKALFNNIEISVMVMKRVMALHSQSGALHTQAMDSKMLSSSRVEHLRAHYIRFPTHSRTVPMWRTLLRQGMLLSTLQTGFST